MIRVDPYKNAVFDTQPGKRKVRAGMSRRLCLLALQNTFGSQASF